MVQTMWNILATLGDTLFRAALLVALGLFAALVFLLLLSLVDHERARSYLSGVSGRLPRLGRWLWPLVTLGLGCLALNITNHSLDLRLSEQLNAHSRNAADPDGQATTQATPSVTLVEPYTYSRTLTLPRNLYARLELAGGWEALAPYLNSANTDELPTVKDIQEAFTVKGKSLYYTREVTMLREQPLALDNSDVRAQLHFGGSESIYNATFNGDYSFTNPQDNVITARFLFPLPVGSGTLSGFRMRVNGQEYRASDLTNGSYWEGEVAPNATVKVSVSYQHQGSRGWNYELSQRREPIRAFALRIESDREAQFGRYSLYPTQNANTLFGPKVMEWKLQDVITAQNVAVLFSQGSESETLRKIHLMTPLALPLAAALCLLWAARRRLVLSPQALGWATLSLSLGFTLGGVLTAYLPASAAEFLGAASGLALALRALSRAYLWPLLLAACAPLTFLSGGDAGLLITALAIVTVLLLGRAQGQGQPL